LAPSIPFFFGVQYSPGINKIEVIAYLKDGFLRVVMCFGQAPFFIFLYIKNEIEIASNDDFVSFEILKVIKEIFKESRIIFVWSINICEGYSFSICF